VRWASVDARPEGPHLTPALSAPGGGEGVTAAGAGCPLCRTDAKEKRLLALEHPVEGLDRVVGRRSFVSFGRGEVI